MDRLTYMIDGYYAVDSADCWEDQNEAYCGPAIDRLAAYEDTGVEPDAISQLKKIPEIFNCDAADPAQLKQILLKLQSWAQAERDGRLVVLPCKVGDTVYYAANGAIKKTEVDAIHQWGSGHWKLSTHTDRRNQHWIGYEIDFAGVGKTAFLTREEAEAALEARKGGEENG